MTDDHVLDDVAWHALTGPQAHLAVTSPDGLATRYRPSVGPFCGVGRLDAAGWSALADLVGPGGTAVFIRGHVEPAPAGWVELVREPGTQYVAASGVDREALTGEVVELHEDDAGDMQRLAAATEPGPFGPESHRTGRWFGVRRDGRLLAMAGERMRVPGFGEVSGVCVDPVARGEGLGAAVTVAAARGIEERGDVAVLHVRDGNAAAHRLYPRVGFAVRRELEVVVVRREGA